MKRSKAGDAILALCQNNSRAVEKWNKEASYLLENGQINLSEGHNSRYVIKNVKRWESVLCQINITQSKKQDAYEIYLLEKILIFFENKIFQER